MPNYDLYRKLLSGDITPEEIQSDNELILMARRVYGREALEDMGVYLEEIESYDAHEQIGDFVDLDLPKPMDEQLFPSGGAKSKGSSEFSLGNGLMKIISTPAPRRVIIIGLSLRLLLAPWTSHSTDIAAHFLGVSEFCSRL